MTCKTPAEHVTRDLDGIYLRVCIEGQWDNRCLTDLVWEDVEAWLNERFKNQSTEDRERQLRVIVSHFHNRLRAIGDQLDLTTSLETAIGSREPGLLNPPTSKGN